MLFRSHAITLRRALTSCRHTVSGSLSLRSRGSFHLSLTVLLLYRSLVYIQPWQMVLPASDKIPRVSSYSGSCSLPLPLSPTGLSPSLAVLPITFGSFSASAFIAAPSTPYLYGLGFSPFARRYSGNHFCFLFLRVLGCFGSPGTSPFQDGILVSDAGFPHSDTGASSLPYSSAPLFAVRCVLLQLRVARHSPYALASLISLFSFSDACFRDFFFL